MFRHLKNGDTATGERTSNRLTGVRREVKYLVDPREGKAIMARMAGHISPKKVKGSASSFRISVYLDTAEHKFARAELAAGRNSIKLRAKDYYLLDGSEPVFDPQCWLEVKARMGAMVEKNRFSVDRADVMRILETHPDPATDATTRASQEAFETVRAGQPLMPLFIVHYLRHTYQDKKSKLRITFDEHVTYHVPPPDLYAGGVICSRGRLAPPLQAEPKWVIEVKTLGAPPVWVDDVLDASLQVAYSKFGTGVAALNNAGLLRGDPGGKDFEARQKR